MTTESMFGHLAGRFVAQREDLATEALHWVLDESSAAEEAMRRLAISLGMADPSGPLVFATQVGGQDDGARPDLVGRDPAGSTPLIVEVKFWASLTSNQPQTYLERLDAGGLLLFVMPSARLATLWPTICDRAGISPSASVAQGDTRSVTLPSGVQLGAVSWRRLMDLLHQAVSLVLDHAAASDLVQLEGLIQRVDSEAFLPLSIEELTGTAPRRVLEFCSIIDEVVGHLITDSAGPDGPLAHKRGLRAGGGAGWYGHWINVALRI